MDQVKREERNQMQKIETNKKQKWKINPKTKRKIYRLLGAEQFQKIVFWAERKKYKTIERFSSKLIEWYEKQCDKAFLRQIKGKSSQEQEALQYHYQMEKLEFRKELTRKKNRNYHYNPNYPTAFVEYLKMNKKIHQRSLIKNLIVLIGSGICFCTIGNSISAVLAVLATLSTIGIIKDFECINLQNYNLCRFQNEKMQIRLKKLEENKKQENLEKLKEGMKPVAKAMEHQIQIPNIDQIIDQITESAQAKQLLEYAKEQLMEFKEEEKSTAEEKGNQKKIGSYKV